MVGNPDKERQYLEPLLSFLSYFCKDAKTSYQILVNAVNTISELHRNHPRISRNNLNIRNEFDEWNKSIKYQSSIKRIALHSFVNNCAIASKIIWPNTDIAKGNEKTRRMKRKEHLNEFFPEHEYPNLTNKSFRNFLEHFDERFDHWDETSTHHNITFDTMSDNPKLENFTTWLNFHPSTLSVTYYDQKEGSKTVKLSAMFDEIEKVHFALPKAMEKIRDSPPHWHDHMLDI